MLSTDVCGSAAHRPSAPHVLVNLARGSIWAAVCAHVIKVVAIQQLEARCGLRPDRVVSRRRLAREREREKQTVTETDRDRCTDTHTDTQTQTHTHRVRVCMCVRAQTQAVTEKRRQRAVSRTRNCRSAAIRRRMAAMVVDATLNVLMKMMFGILCSVSSLEGMLLAVADVLVRLPADGTELCSASDPQLHVEQDAR